MFSELKWSTIVSWISAQLVSTFDSHTSPSVAIQFRHYFGEQTNVRWSSHAWRPQVHIWMRWWWWCSLVSAFGCIGMQFVWPNAFAFVQREHRKTDMEEQIPHNRFNRSREAKANILVLIENIFSVVNHPRRCFVSPFFWFTIYDETQDP